MVGMLQIITYLLCVYLVIKGIEIFQIALMSPRENRTPGLVLGGLVVAACVLSALFFTYMIDVQAQHVSK